MSITTKDIALLAGVSQSTVSRCLNDSHLISEETKSRVKQIAKEQGFQFNVSARGLATNKKGTISVVYPDDYEKFNVNLYYSSLHNELRDCLEKMNLDLIVVFEKHKYTGDSNIKRLIRQDKIDGLIIAKPGLDRDTLQFLRNSNIPFVFMHHYSDYIELEDIDIVYTEHFKGGYLAGQYLAQIGHKNIMYISSKDKITEYEQRILGFKAALEDYRIHEGKHLHFCGEGSFQCGYEIIKKNINELKSISAIFAQNDIMALGMIEALKELKINVPKDISVIGYDDIELGIYSRPHLTTIHQPRKEIAKLTSSRIGELINSKKTSKHKKISIEPSLIIRDSCL